MDTKLKIEKYRKIILDYFQEKASIKAANLPDCENVVVTDTLQNHYQLLTMGWNGSRYIYALSFHLDIAQDGKIWIRANWTDIDIADVLVKLGVPKSDIVIGFYPEYAREETEYAVK